MRRLELSPGKHTIIDDEDYATVRRYNWHLSSSGYASGRLKNQGRGAARVLMHRLILQPTNGSQVDHIDGNKLNNRRYNLRLASHSENCRNSAKREGSYSSQYKGVHWDKQCKKWRATIQLEGKGKYLGIFRTEAEAAVAYDIAAKTHFGEFAKLNFPSDEDIGNPSWQCLLCNMQRKVVEIAGMYEHQRMMLCLPCIRYISAHASAGDRITRSPYVRQRKGELPNITSNKKE